MESKLLAVKEGKNVSLYSVAFDFYSLNEFIKQLEEKYSFNETVTMETTLLNGVVLSMREYDLKSDVCRVKEDYKLIRDVEVINEYEKKSIIEIEVEYFSQIAKVLRETFLDNKPLLNTTSLIVLMNSLYNFSNNFSYNPIIDNKDLTWDDPRRLSDSKLNMSMINEKLNSKRIKFNKKESEKLFDLLSHVVDRLENYIKLEQVGLFPIEEKMPEYNELLTAFAVRNESCELFFGSLKNVEFNFAGFGIVNAKKDEIISTYNLNDSLKEPQKQKNRIDAFNKFLQF